MEAKGIGPVDLESLLGWRIKQARLNRGLAQIDLAQRAKAKGLAWSKSTVGQIESNVRQVGLSELLLLTVILGVELTELLAPEGDNGTIRLPDSKAIIKAADLRRILASQAKEVADHTTSQDNTHLVAQRIIGRLTDINPEAPGQADQAIARRLGWSEQQVLHLSNHLWGHSATFERTRRLLDQDLSQMAPRAIGVVKGRITRVLMDELRAGDAGQEREPERPLP